MSADPCSGDLTPFDLAQRMVDGLEVSPPGRVEVARWALEMEARLAAEREIRDLAGELLESLRISSTTSDAYRDAHAAFLRWAVRHAPKATSDEAEREAIDAPLKSGRGDGVEPRARKRCVQCDEHDAQEGRPMCIYCSLVWSPSP